MPQIIEAYPPHVTTLAKLALGSPTADTVYPTAAGTFLATTQLIDFAEFSNGISSQFADGNRNRGAFDRFKNRTRQSRLMIEPSLDAIPTVDEWNYLLSWIFGDTGSGTTTKTYKLKNNVGDQNHERNVQYSDGNGNTESFACCAIKEAVITTAGNENLVSLRASLSGRDYQTNVAFPSLSNLDNTKTPFVLPDSDLYITFNGSPILVENVSITISQAIDPNRNFNKLTQSRNVKTDRMVRVSFDYPDGGFPTLWNSAETGYAMVVKFVNGSYEMTFTFVDVRAAREPRRYGTRTEVKNTFNGMAYGTGTQTQPLDDSLIASIKLS